MFDPSAVQSAVSLNFPWVSWELILRILTAGICGAFIGLERGIRQKEAGVRTHTIVAMGGALLMIISKYAFSDLWADGAFLLGTTGADPTRVASQAITAIAFLGAGVIFRHGNMVHGLTTAAGIWATAAIGLCIGAGLYTVGVVTALLVLLINICLHKWLVKLESMANSTVHIVIKDNQEALIHLREQLDDRKMQVQRMEIKKKDGGLLRIGMTVRVSKNSALNDLLSFLSDNLDIMELDIGV